MDVSKLINHKGRFKKISIEDLIMPIFVREGISGKTPVVSMPGIFQYTIDQAATEAKELESLGVRAVILFGIPEKKDKNASQAFNSQGIVQQAIKAIKSKADNLIVITDCCLCQYTEDGQCGYLLDDTIDNDTTRDLLAKTAVSQAEAGADMIAPSGMITQQVKIIRRTLDQNGFDNTKIMSYSAKYASNFYGPFREAGGSSFTGQTRNTQLDPLDIDSSVKEVLEDIKEGADITMVKPALSYLDVIAKVRQSIDVTLAAYNVSGEYSMVKFASQNNAFDERKIVNEILLSIKRAGADLIITYFAKQVAEKS